MFIQYAESILEVYLFFSSHDGQIICPVVLPNFKKSVTEYTILILNDIFLLRQRRWSKHHASQDRVVRVFNPTQPTKGLILPNATRSQMKTLDPQTNLSHHQTELRTTNNKRSGRRKTILGTLFHRNIMTVSKTPVNKHDKIVSNMPLSMD